MMTEKALALSVENDYNGGLLEIPEVEAGMIRPGRTYFFLKRLFDIFASIIALILLSPFFLIIAVVVYIDNPGPVFFGHKRLGQYGKPITVWKFRSMCVNAEDMIRRLSPEQKAEYYKNFKLDNDPRITRVGLFLRRTSLDELPQFVNVLMGDMSLVGPRPIILKELEMYGKDKDRFLAMKPGITGLWQANGRSDITYENGRCDLELYYADHMGFKLDLKILFRTVFVVLMKKGAR